MTGWLLTLLCIALALWSAYDALGDWVDYRYAQWTTLKKKHLRSFAWNILVIVASIITAFNLAPLL